MSNWANLWDKENEERELAIAKALADYCVKDWVDIKQDFLDDWPDTDVEEITRIFDVRKEDIINQLYLDWCNKKFRITN